MNAGARLKVLCYNEYMDEVVIRASDLRKAYGSGETVFEALRGVNIEIKRGESVAIIGKSGSGKSTLMHLLALLDKPTSGSLVVMGQSVDKLKKARLNALRSSTFGFIFQQFFMNANETVFQNVQLPLKIAKIKRKERKVRATKALEQVELLDKIKNKAKNLSGGQKQRVCIARAIVNDPDIIFADEPTGNLDSETGSKIEDLLFELHRNMGKTLIIVTHDAEIAAKCQRQIILKDGLIAN